MNRGALEVETLLKIVLVLVIVWLVVEIVSALVGTIFRVLQPLLGLVIVALIVLWLLDRI